MLTLLFQVGGENLFLTIFGSFEDKFIPDLNDYYQWEETQKNQDELFKRSIELENCLIHCYVRSACFRN
jgi:hypothetical protein